MVSLAEFSAAISSRIGATARHGPHHSAQKSTSTGLSLFRTSASNDASVTGAVLAPTGDPSFGRRLSAVLLVCVLSGRTGRAVRWGWVSARALGRGRQRGQPGSAPRRERPRTRYRPR